jgi:hypothetical protein
MKTFASVPLVTENENDPSAAEVVCKVTPELSKRKTGTPSNGQL